MNTQNTPAHELSLDETAAPEERLTVEVPTEIQAGKPYSGCKSVGLNEMES